MIATCGYIGCFILFIAAVAEDTAVYARLVIAGIGAFLLAISAVARALKGGNDDD